MNMNAVRIHQNGWPEEMRWESVPMPSIGQKEVLVRDRDRGQTKQVCEESTLTDFAATIPCYR
jgi:hypothetical protein